MWSWPNQSPWWSQHRRNLINLVVYFPFANYSSHFLLDILWSKFHCISSVLLCLIEWVYPTVFKISNFLVAKLHIIIWVILSVFCGSGIFRSLNKGWEFMFLSWVPVSKLFCILVGDFRCPSVPPIIISRASRRTMIWERRFVLAAKIWHLALVTCVPVASHVAFLDLRLIIALWLVIRIKGNTECRGTL